MIRRILGWFGIVPYIPHIPLPQGSAAEQVASDGHLEVRFAQGKKAELTPEEWEEISAKGIQPVKEDGLVWPGKTVHYHIRNERHVVARFTVTLTDLDHALVISKPPVGGLIAPEGGVILQPNEEAVFEFVFVQPSLQTPPRPKFFQFVITCFNPNRLNDPGEIIGEEAARWVNLPDQNDFALRASLGNAIMRPWRRSVVLKMELFNRSHLPPNVRLRILRSPTKEGLPDKGEEIGSVAHALEPRRSGIWHALLPATEGRNSYFLTVSGSVQVAESKTFVLHIERMLYVRYVPWLRMARDWFFAFFLLFFLIWAFYGVPIYKTATISVALYAEDNNAPITTLAPLKLKLIPLYGDRAGAPIEGDYIPGDKRFVFKVSGWEGARFPWDWNLDSRTPLRFRLQAVNTGNDALLMKYEMNQLYSQFDASSMAASVPEFQTAGSASITAYLKTSESLSIRLVSSLEGVTGDFVEAELTYRIGGGNEQKVNFTFHKDGEQLISDPILLSSEAKNEKVTLRVKLLTSSNVASESGETYVQLQANRVPTNVKIEFQKLVWLVIQPEGCSTFPEKGSVEIFDMLDNLIKKKDFYANQDSFTISIPIVKEDIDVKVIVSIKERVRYNQIHSLSRQDKEVPIPVPVKENP